MLKLTIPPEPQEVKESIKQGLKENRELEIMNLKQGTWIASPLWTGYGWKHELKAHGITWQRFMSIVREHFPYSIWLNPIRSSGWSYVRSIVMIKEIFPMYELTLEGLEEGVKYLLTRS